MAYFYRKERYIFLAILIDFILWLLSPIIRKNQQLPKSINNILIVRADHLGDILYVLPSTAAIKAKYPGAKITLLAGPWAKELLAGNPNIDQVIYFSFPWFSRSKDKAGLIDLFKLISNLRRQNFDIAIDFKGYLWNIFILWMIKAKATVSYADVGAKALLNFPLTRRTDLHAVNQNQNMLDKIGITSSVSPKFFLEISEENIEKIETLFQRCNLKGKKLICLHCTAGRASKMWSLANYHELIEGLFDQFPGIEVLLVGTKGERSFLKDFDFSKKQPINLMGEVSIKELFVLLKQCALFIGNDSFPAHLSALAGNTTMVLFSNEDDPVQWKPFGEKVVVIQKEPYNFKSLNDKSILSSLKKISVSEVLNKAKELLK